MSRGYSDLLQALIWKTMGSIFSLAKSRIQSNNTASNRNPGKTSTTRTSSYRRQTQPPGSRSSSFTYLRRTPFSKMASSSVGKSEEAHKKKTTAKNKYQCIPDNFTSLDQVASQIFFIIIFFFHKKICTTNLKLYRSCYTYQ